jgi:hypothetical protein
MFAKLDAITNERYLPDIIMPRRIMLKLSGQVGPSSPINERRVRAALSR